MTTDVWLEGGSVEYASGDAPIFNLKLTEDIVIPAHDRVVSQIWITINLSPGTCARTVPVWDNVQDGINVAADIILPGVSTPVKIVLLNHSNADYTVKAGDVVAQLVIEQLWPGPVVIHE